MLEMVSDSTGDGKENTEGVYKEAGRREHTWTHSFGNSQGTPVLC